jgi:alpha-tubulin suppressor-like RCC1 family protein
MNHDLFQHKRKAPINLKTASQQQHFFIIQIRTVENQGKNKRGRITPQDFDRYALRQVVKKRRLP